MKLDYLQETAEHDVVVVLDKVFPTHPEHTIVLSLHVKLTAKLWSPLGRVVAPRTFPLSMPPRISKLQQLVRLPVLLHLSQLKKRVCMARYDSHSHVLLFSVWTLHVLGVIPNQIKKIFLGECSPGSYNRPKTSPPSPSSRDTSRTFRS